MKKTDVNLDENKVTIWDWRPFFTRDILELAKKDVGAEKIVNFSSDPERRWAECDAGSGFHVKVKSIPATYEEYLKYPKWTMLYGGQYARGEYLFSNYYFCECSQGSKGIRCRHLASLLLYWEKQQGPFVMFEDEEARQERIQKAKDEAERQKKQKRVMRVPDYLVKYLTPTPTSLFFPPDAIIRETNLETDQYETDQADRLLQHPEKISVQMEYAFDYRQKQNLRIMGNAGDNNVVMNLSRERITAISCDCGRTGLYTYTYLYSQSTKPGRLCCHALAVWVQARERIIRENPGDETDFAGDKLLSLLAGKTATETIEEAAPMLRAKKKENIVLSPRITRDRNTNLLKLSFDISRVGEKSFAVSSLEKFVSAVEKGEPYNPNKTLSIHFGEEAFTEDSVKWYQMMTSRVRSIQRVNDRLSNSGGYGYYNRELSAGNGIPLENSDLDIVYDLASEKGEIRYQYGARTEVCTVRVGEAHPKAEIQLDPIKAGKTLQGVQISGQMPRMLQGAQQKYILDRTCFGRVSGDELKVFAPFTAISDGNGSFRCAIGVKKFAEFFYRVLPALQEQDQLILIDHVGSLAEGILPPEPEFTFYIDLAEDRITCRPVVQYGEETNPVGMNTARPGRQKYDWDQENRVTEVIRHFFPTINRDKQWFSTAFQDETLAWILTDGVASLSRFGTVKGSDAFNRVHMRPAPQPRISVEVDGGLLDLSIQTKELSEEELLAVLASYRLRKRWHRLKNGDFVDLRNAERLDELEETAHEMDISLEELIQGSAKVPKYRALYVDRLLEAHNELAASRDRQFKALIRSFQTIRDSDFEVSESLADVMRPYQIYGFRWLSTLSQSGFGGILADEMGLGKTVQMLSFMQSRYESGETLPSLVVCPASLVFNWKEECRKFTPSLKVETIAGGLAQRRTLLRSIKENEEAALYITSYDLMKRDIALYDDLRFSTVVLDEAQYVKNQSAAVSKAVRVLKAEHRFALTGTPIENRLSELWSIFDFLMPGFLYTAREFADRFERPIMKQKDEAATQRLSKMTEPFILRRKKTDVLKDLPDKLEETQSTAMEEDQRKLYDAQVVRMKQLLESSGDSGEDKMRILAEITRLRQICCDPSLLFEDYKGTSAKREACLELVQSAMDGGHRMLVFSQFTSMLDLLAADLRGADIPFFTITGSTPKQERVKLVNEFNGGDVPVFLISLKAGGTGLNLTGADVVIHYDPWWNLAVQNQATDRAHRIGQTRQVTVVKLIAADTIEERIVEMQEAKRDLAEAIMSGQSNSLMSLSREELMALIG